MKLQSIIITSLMLLFSMGSSFASERPIALVWKNGGTCFPYCATSAGKMAVKAGYDVRYITKNTKHLKEALKIAKVWIQPGGKSKKAASRMGVDTMKLIKEFVRDGGGYVGFCAGMLLATEKIGTSDIDGLGILSGKTIHLMDDAQDRPYILDIDLVDEGERNIYFSGGPYLIDQDYKTNVWANYRNGEIAAVESTYGAGRVVVSGFHPEVPRWWKKVTRMFDADGSDHDIAVKMIKKAGNIF